MTYFTATLCERERKSMSITAHREFNHDLRLILRCRGLCNRFQAEEECKQVCCVLTHITGREFYAAETIDA